LLLEYTFNGLKVDHLEGENNLMTVIFIRRTHTDMHREGYVKEAHIGVMQP
jgi:hypothetical protein